MDENYYLRRAIELAVHAHSLQVLKNGLPYITHPFHVMESMETNDERAVAILHDVVEDTMVTMADLRQKFPVEICDAVEAITKIGGEEYENYIQRVYANQIARKVKIADIKHNLDLTRNETVVMSVSKLNKYLWALKLLQGKKNE